MVEQNTHSKPVTKVMIVDDELNARNRLVDLLSDISSYYPLQVVGEAKNGIEALKLLESLEVDVVLCDITMPEMDGLEFSRHAKYLNVLPKIIFITAYDDYAIQAFEVHAIDYLVKPVRTQRLFEALKRVAATTSTNTVDMLSEVPRRYLNCTEFGRIILIPVHTICYIKSDDKYIRAVTLERDYWINDTLGNIEKEFSDLFLRVHRSYLVAKKLIIALEKTSPKTESSYILRLIGMDIKIPVSRRQLATIKTYIKDLAQQRH